MSDLGRFTLIINRKYCISVKKFYNQHKFLRVHSAAGLWRTTIGTKPHRMKQWYTSKDISRTISCSPAHAEISTGIWRDFSNSIGCFREAGNMLNKGHFFFFWFCLPGYWYNQVFICVCVFILLWFSDLHYMCKFSTWGCLSTVERKVFQDTSPA